MFYYFWRERLNKLQRNWHGDSLNLTFYIRPQFAQSGFNIFNINMAALKFCRKCFDVWQDFLKATANKNLNIVKNKNMGFDLVSAFHSAGELLAVSSRQHTTGIRNFQKLHATQSSMCDTSPSPFHFSSMKRSSIHVSNANCLLGELLKKLWSFVSWLHHIAISQMLQHFTTHRFNLCDGQCV